METKPLKVVYIGDGPTHTGSDGLVSEWVTGFAQVSKQLCGGLHERGFDVHLLALNYTGDPHNLPFKIYCPSSVQRDLYGITRALELCRVLKPDVVFINNDLWICEAHAKHLTRLGDEMPALVCYVPCDAEGHRPAHVAWLHRTHELLGRAFRIIPYTHFGKSQWQKAGYWRTSTPIGHGLDPVYKERGRRLSPPELLELAGGPIPVPTPYTWEDIRKEKIDARIEFGQGGIGPETFVVVNNDRNSARKRLDILVDAFCRFAKMVKEKEGFLGGPTKDEWAAYQVEVEAYQQDAKRWNEELADAKVELEPKVEEVKARWKESVSEVLGEGFGVNVELGNVFHPRMRPAPQPPATPEWERDPLVKLWLHTNLTEHYDLPDLLKQKFAEYGITEEEGEAITLFTDVDGAGYTAITTEQMRRVYLASDCYVKVAPEGWGLGPFEAAACGCYNILPKNTIHEELWSGHADFVNCPVEMWGVPGMMLSKIPMAEDVTKAMFTAWQYRHVHMPEEAAFRYVMSERFDWGRLVDRFVGEIEGAAAGRKKEG